MSIQTGEDTPAPGLVPFLSVFPLVISNGAIIFLLPDIVLFSTTCAPFPRQYPAPGPATHSVESPIISNGAVVSLLHDLALFSTTCAPFPRQHPAPGPVTHSVEPPKGTWIVSYVTGYDDDTLFNIRTRRPLNGTARLVTRQVITYVALDEFAGSPISEDDDASIATHVYGAAPHSLGLTGFPGLELESQVHGSPLGTMIAGSLASSRKATHGRTCLWNIFSPLFESEFTDSTTISPDSKLLAPTFASLPLGSTCLLAELPLSVTEPCGFEAWTSEEELKWCGFLGKIVETFLGTVVPILVPGYTLAFLKALLFCSFNQWIIRKLVSLHHAALAQTRTWIFKL
ncbi:hypothetical protein FRC01_006550, partial [Tulasnella sp. 417]